MPVMRNMHLICVQSWTYLPHSVQYSGKPNYPSEIPVLAFERVIYDQLYVHLTRISPVSVQFTRRLRLYPRQQMVGL